MGAMLYQLQLSYMKPSTLGTGQFVGFIHPFMLQKPEMNQILIIIRRTQMCQLVIYKSGHQCSISDGNIYCLAQPGYFFASKTHFCIGGQTLHFYGHFCECLW